jgi:Ca-activated chloride channel family protein
MAVMLIPLFGLLRPERLYWLLLIPVFLGLYFGILFFRRSRAKKKTRASALERILPRQQAWKRHLAVGAAVLSLAALVVAYAQPSGEVEVPRERATVVLTIDVSRSMLAVDVEPDRLTAAKVAAKQFLGLLPEGFNVSLVTFAGTTSIVVGPTLDRGAVAAAIDELDVAPSTAIGDGIYSALDALEQAPSDPDEPDKPAPGAIVLLSDGFTNIGRSSADAAKASKEKGYSIYSIAFGTPNGYVVNGRHEEPVPVDHAELEQVARLSGGKKFEASSLDELQEVYASIARSVGYVKVEEEVTEQYAGYALLLAVIASLAMVSLAARWP